MLSAVPGIQNVDGQAQRQRAAQHMRANFERWLQTPDAYRQLVERECGYFPEGHLYPYFLTSMAFSHLAIQEPQNAKAHLTRANQLIRLGLPSAGRIVNPNGGDLLSLKDYDQQATTLSTVSLALGLYRRAGGQDAALDKYHRHINQLLADALTRSNGGLITSYPDYSWTYDTHASLLALRLAPEMTPNISVKALWTKHQLWIQRYAIDHKTHLPNSMLAQSQGPAAPPRGCDLMMRVMVLAYVDPAAAQQLFNQIRPVLEREVGQFYGFSEYPAGIQPIEDNDSGPIVMGMGMTATGLAIGSAQAADQPAVANRLSQQFVLREPLLAMSQTMSPKALPGQWFWGAVKINPQYFTGFLFGDAVLFYTLTWAPLPAP